jgi:hypothetical protein
MFFEYGENVIDSAHFDHDQSKTPINVRRTTLGDGLVVATEICARHGRGSAKFFYRGGLPAQMKSRQQERGRAAWNDHYRFTHDAMGQLKLIERESSRIWSVVYQRPTKKQSTAALAKLIKTRLWEQIPRAFAAARVKKPVYCLVLAYDCENPGRYLPPQLALGFEEERRRWTQEHGKSAAAYLWNPAEFSLNGSKALTLGDRPLHNACDLFTQELALRDRIGPIVKLLVDICRELNRRDWSKTLTVVVPIDFECAHVARNLAAVRRGTSTTR